MSRLAAQYQSKLETSIDVLQKLCNEHDKVTFANSLGAEDMVLTDILCKQFPQITIFSLDTGRLPNETYELMQKVEQRYGRVIQYYYPEAQSIETFVRNNGINAFYESVELRKQCCQIRKVEPLKRALQGQQAWISGMRRDQSVTRQTLAILEYDEAFGLVKANPLAEWQEKEVWAYLSANDVPYNALHDQHYPTIGCAPCTRAIAKGEDIRAGRWWWENPETKECGVNTGEVSTIQPG